MSFHTDYESWIKMSDSRNCPACLNEPMPPGTVDVAELPHSWLIAEPFECLYGACHLVAKKHVIELYELDDVELLGLMKDVSRCARAVKTVTNSVKINYEIHGNTAPHLHVHLYPRYLDDPFPGRAIDYSQKINQYPAEGEFERFVSTLKQTIEGGQDANA